MIKIVYSKTFLRSYKRITKNNHDLRKRYEVFIVKFIQDPFHIGLRTHKIFKEEGYFYSSRVTGDIRILWRYIDSENVLFLATGGHEGKSSVYR